MPVLTVWASAQVAVVAPQSLGIQASIVVLPPQPNLHLLEHNGCSSPCHHSHLPDEGRGGRGEEVGEGLCLSSGVTTWKLHASFMLTSYCPSHNQMVTLSFKGSWEM